VIAMSGGRIVCDAPPAEFLAWAGSAAPQLTTPGARLLGGLGLRPVPGVRAARRALRAAGVPLAHGAGADLALGNAAGAVAATGGAAATPGAAAAGPGVTARALRASPQPPALTLDRTWCEIRHGPAILRGVSLSVGAGERLALMGRNGAGKSTLLRCAAGLAKPTRGSLRAAGRVALLLQNPTDYLVHDTVGEEASAAALEAAGLDRALCSRHPRDLSGGERQRLALAVVLDGGTERAEQLAVVCLDEPTRGMDRARKEELAGWLRRMGLAVIVATHDTEFAAAFAQRVVLLGEGTVIADGPVSDVLTGGAYFVTETARILGGAGGALTAEDGIALLSGRSSADERSRLRPPEEVVA
jgi:energy-coupling factor transport system ATP-binding protein